GDGSLGNRWLSLNSRTGALACTYILRTSTTCYIFLQSMFPLHSGRILGLGGRLLISLMGLAIATLSVTGVLIWARKQRGRRQGARTRNTVPLASRP
ncbi:PepSY-associated TM helix domain-containing protein, partial [Ideonella sp. B508-1]|uniref:PepSY-associated TM helix domain-containing protein n=1 Tax=Ideonella sp. B508-1 TaxID=137716 RepID=UPI00058B9E6C